MKEKIPIIKFTFVFINKLIQKNNNHGLNN